MFGRPANPYDEVVAKATDEKQTEINWEIALTVWDKVNEDGETGARNCVAALQKRLTHRSANVQLFSLTLAGALVSNCGPPLHREISGKAFTSALARLVNDRTTHETVKREALKQIEVWVKEHQGNADFDLMAETYEALQKQGHALQPPRPPTPKGPSDDLLRREEEELQRALAESAALADPQRNYTPSGGASNQYPSARPPAPAERDLPSHARALYDFRGESDDELTFAQGDLVRVIDAVSDEWWRGELRGRTGIFPTNYVEPASAPSGMNGGAPPPRATPDDAEGEVFAQAAAIDRLLALMHSLRARGEDFADNEELTDLYNSSMALRPRVVQLIRKYDQKQTELRAFNDKVEQAKAAYERNAGYAQNQYPQQHPPFVHQQSAPQLHHQPPPQLQQQHSYPQPNGYAPSPLQQGRPAVDAYGRSFSPAAAPSMAAPAAQSPAPGMQPQTAPGLSSREEEERREYERQYAEYQRQLEEYNRQVAAIQAQQSQGAPSPAVAHASASQGGPAPTESRGQAGGAPQPVWDAQANQWIWPQLQADVSAPSSAPAAPSLASPGPQPQMTSPHPAGPSLPTEQMANMSIASPAIGAVHISSPAAPAGPYGQPYPSGGPATSPPPPGMHPGPGMASPAAYTDSGMTAQYGYSAQPHGYAQPYPSQ